MNGEDLGHGKLGAVHWACAYAGSTLTCVVSAFSLDALGLGPVGLVVIPIVATLITNSLRGGYRLAAPGLFLAAPVLLVSFFVVIFLDVVA